MKWPARGSLVWRLYALGLAQLVLLAPQVVLGRHLDSDQVLFRRARRVVVRSDPPMWLSVEGEVLGKTPAAYQVLPRALEMITGAPSERSLTVW